MPAYGGHEDWYEKAAGYWYEIDETQYLNAAEIQEIYPVFLTFLADMTNGIAPESSLAFADLEAYFGWDYDTFDWEEFREWYDSI